MKRTKKIKTILFAAVISGLLFYFILNLSGCEQAISLKDKVISRLGSEDAQEEAVATVKGFFDSLVNDEPEEAFKYVYVPQTQGLQQDGKKIEDFKKELIGVTKIISYKINWVEVKNNIAIVGVDLIDFYDGEEKMYKDLQVSLLQDSEGKWKINFWE